MSQAPIVIQAAELRGGDVASFAGREVFSPDGRVNTSVSRFCVELANEPISGTFFIDDVPKSGEALFRIRGMWDMYSDLPYEMIKASTLLDMKGVFEVELNGERVFDGEMVFWSYRLWRFWPAFDIPFSTGVLVSGENSFIITNKTGGFNVLNRSTPPASRFLENTKYQISDVRILLPETIRKVLRDSNASLSFPASRLLPEGTFLGHTLAWHDIAHFADEDYSRAIDMFVACGQGNLLVFVMNPGKKNFDVDLDAVDTDKIKRLGLKVVLRYSGKNDQATVSEEEYVAKLKRFADCLNDDFIGFGPHEQHGEMRRIINSNPSKEDIPFYANEYTAIFKRKLEQIREIRGDVPVWDTDPSFYSRFHIKAGANMPAIELCVYDIPLDIASARGTAKAFGMKKWAAVNAFECQAYGGLSMCDQDVENVALFEKRRSDLWWLSQHSLYLGGARIIYSESGLFCHAVTIQREFDHPHLVDLRKSHSQLVDFAAKEKLQGQPIAEIAYLQGRHDIYKGTMFIDPELSVMGNSLYAWKSLEVCYPEVKRPIPTSRTDRQAGVSAKIHAFSDIPYGNADILPVEAGADTLCQYKMLIVTGWHTMIDEDFAKLISYVRQGGHITILLPHLTASVSKSDPTSFINPEWLKSLCGVELVDERRIVSRLDELTMSAGDYGFKRTESFLAAGNSDGLSETFSMRKLRIVDSQTRILLENKRNDTPFLVERSLGKGKVYLCNLADFSDSEMVCEFVNETIRDAADHIHFDVMLKSGCNINYFVYAAGNEESERYRIYFLNTDWFGSGGVRHAVFEAFDETFEIDVPLRDVVVFDIVSKNGKD